MGLIDDVYHTEDSDPQEQMRSQTLLLYWAHCKEPLSGICVFRRTKWSVALAPCHVCFWHHEIKRAVQITTVGRSKRLPLERYLQPLPAGEYCLSHKSDSVLFYFAPADCGEYEHALQYHGFPTRSSLRVVGLDNSLTSLGVERGRLFQMSVRTLLL